jgi:hypothetical protein
VRVAIGHNKLVGALNGDFLSHHNLLLHAVRRVHQTMFEIKLSQNGLNELKDGANVSYVLTSSV